MKPYVVEIRVRTVVMAHDEAHAHIVAEDEFREIASDSQPDIDVENVVLEARHLPTGWDLRCIPYGGDGNTCLQDLIAVEPTNG